MNETWPLAQPDRHDPAPTGPYLGFGDPGPAIGQIAAVTSVEDASKPEPSWWSQLGPRIGAAAAAAFFPFPVLCPSTLRVGATPAPSTA